MPLLGAVRARNLPTTRRPAPGLILDWRRESAAGRRRWCGSTTPCSRSGSAKPGCRSRCCGRPGATSTSGTTAPDGRASRCCPTGTPVLRRRLSGASDESSDPRPRGPRGEARSAPTAADRVRRRASHRRGLEAGIEFAAQFRSRSFNNTMLITVQHYAAYTEGRVPEPTPTYVAGFHQWLCLGRHVMKGQSGYGDPRPGHRPVRLREPRPTRTPGAVSPGARSPASARPSARR